MAAVKPLVVGPSLGYGEQHTPTSARSYCSGPCRGCGKRSSRREPLTSPRGLSPRCGEQASPSPDRRAFWEPSPQARRAGVRAHVGVDDPRTIPAGAGNSALTSALMQSLPGPSPREQAAVAYLAAGFEGPFPRVRGAASQPASWGLAFTRAPRMRGADQGGHRTPGPTPRMPGARVPARSGAGGLGLSLRALAADNAEWTALMNRKPSPANAGSGTA